MSEHVEHITDQDFETRVLGSDLPVLVDFWAPWCRPCVALGPVLESIAKDREGEVKVVKVNVEENVHVASQMGIRSIPAVMLFDEGELKGMMVGARPRADFDKLIDGAVA